MNTRIRNRNSPSTALFGYMAVAIIVASSLGCKGGEEKNTNTGHPASVPAEAGTDHTPYYFGLIEEYRNILAEDPENLAAIIALGNAYYDNKQWKEAIQYYERALDRDASNTDVITDMGTCYRNLGKPERAVAEYKRVLKMEPGHLNALFNLGVVEGYDQKNYAAAIRVWEHLLQVAPNHPQAEYLQASIARFKRALGKKVP